MHHSPQRRANLGGELHKMNRLQKRWSSVPGVVFPNAAINKSVWAQVPGVVFPKQEDKQEEKPAAKKQEKKEDHKTKKKKNFVHSLHKQDPESYTKEGKFRVLHLQDMPDARFWCSNAEACELLHLGASALCHLAKRHNIPFVKVNTFNTKGIIAQMVYYSRACIKQELKARIENIRVKHELVAKKAAQMAKKWRAQARKENEQ